MATQPTIGAGADDWLVYADQLQAQGDARGELIVLNHAVASGTSPEARDNFVKANAERLLGKAGSRLDALRLGWRWLWIDTVEISAKSDADVLGAAALFELPAISELTSLTIGGDARTERDTIDMTPVIAAVASHGLPGVRALSLIDARAARSSSVIATDYAPPDNLIEFGELGPLWSKLDRVERVHFSVNDMMQVKWGEIALPSVKSFRVDCLTCGGQAEIPDAFAEANWPHLEELALRLPEAWTFSIPDDPNGYVRPYVDRDDEEYEDDDGYHDGFDWSGPLESLLTSLAKTRLKKLALTSFASPSSVLETLRSVGLPETLVELDLSDSSFDGSAVELLLRDDSLLRRVKRLVLRNVPATKEQIAPLVGRGLDVTHSEGAGATYRFLVGME